MVNEKNKEKPNTVRYHTMFLVWYTLEGSYLRTIRTIAKICKIYLIDQLKNKVKSICDSKDDSTATGS